MSKDPNNPDRILIVKVDDLIENPGATHSIDGEGVLTKLIYKLKVKNADGEYVKMKTKNIPISLIFNTLVNFIVDALVSGVEDGDIPAADANKVAEELALKLRGTVAVNLSGGSFSNDSHVNEAFSVLENLRKQASDFEPPSTQPRFPTKRDLN